jgi:P-type Cu+ transporter
MTVTSTARSASVPDETVELSIGGMTCASCAARIQKKLNRLPGVTATVNYATEKAQVTYAGGITADDLVDAVRASGYTATLPVQTLGAADDALVSSAAAEPSDRLRRRLVISAGLSAPVILLSMTPAAQFPYWQWISLALTLPVVTWAAQPFHAATWANLRHRAVTMDTLISMGVIAAFGWSIYALVFGGAGQPSMHMPFSLVPRRSSGASDVYFEVASGVTTFILAGRYLEAQAKRQSGAALRALLTRGAKEVCVLRAPDGTEERIPVDRLAVGDRFVVRPGETVAADGIVEQGTSAVDAALLTGEPVPVDVGPGDPVAGGTVSASGRLVVRATGVGADTALARIGRLVVAAQAGKAPSQRLADRVASVFVPVVIMLAAVTLLAWLATGAEAEVAFTAAVAVLIIACPCALGLATPTALLVGTGRGAELGIVIKGPEVLESTRRVDTIVLDKTGTVTTGRMAVVDVVPTAGMSAEKLLRLTGALEAASEHPIASAIAARARAAGEMPSVAEFRSFPGQGVSGVVEGRLVAAGQRTWVAELTGAPSAAFVAAADAYEAAGRSVTWIGFDGGPKGIVAVADTVKETSAEAVSMLRRLGLRPMLLTGDNGRSANAVAHSVGIAPTDVLAEVLPADKVAAIASLQAGGATVAMVGDGVNDAAALTQADLGLAMGTGTDVAIEASDLTLVSGDLRAAATAIELSRATLNTIKGNLFWAFAYNVAALPLAATGLLNPLFAGAAMALSSLFVVTNSLRLSRFQPRSLPSRA